MSGALADRLLDAAEARREHADDRDRHVVHANRCADDVRMLPKRDIQYL